MNYLVISRRLSYGRKLHWNIPHSISIQFLYCRRHTSYSTSYNGDTFNPIRKRNFFYINIIKKKYLSLISRYMEKEK